MPTLELVHRINGFEERQKMPRGQGRNGSNVEKVAGRRNCSFLRSSLGESNKKFFPEERQISALVLGNTEQRCIIFTLVAPELEAYFKLATLLESLQGPDERTHFPSAALSESPSTIIFLINLQKEHKTNLSENTCSPEPSSACSSSGMHTMGQSRNRNKRTKSLKDSSNTSAPRCLAGDTSGSLCDSLSPLNSDDLVSDISKVEKPLKKSSKKKAKKKGKNYKRSISKKDSTDLEGHFEGGTCSAASVVETSTGCPPACSAAQISENLSEIAISYPSFLVENISIAKGNNETDNCADRSMTMMSCISYKDEMEKSEAVVSLSQEFSHEEFTNSCTGEVITTSSTTHSPESVPSTVYANVRSASPKRSSNPNDNSTSISIDLYDDEAVVSSLLDHLKSDVSENCSNDVETRLALKDKSGFDISREEDSDSRKHDPSCCRTTVNSMVINDGVPNDCATSECYCPEVLHADTNTERAECNSQACSSSDFHPVLSGKRGMAARKLTAHTGKDNNHPVWQKVQKMDTRHCISKPKNLYAVSLKVDSYSKDSGARVKLNASSGFKQKVKAGKHLYSYEIVSETSKSNEINDRKKHSSVSKKVNHYSRKGSQTGNVNTPKPSKIHIQQKEGLKIMPQVNHVEHSCSGLSSHCNTDSPMPMVKSTGKLDFCPSVQQQKREEHVDEAALSGNTCSTAGEMTSSVESNQIGPLPSTLDSSGQSHKIHIEEHADNNDFRDYEHLHNHFDLMDNTYNQCKKLQAEFFHAEYREADDNFGPVLQKWVPVGRKDAAVSHTGHVENLTASESISNMVGNAEIEVSSDVQYSVPSTGTKMQYSSRSGDDADCSSFEADTLSDTLMTCSRTAEDFGVANESNFQLTREVKDQICLKTDLDKILHAVNDAGKLHTAAGIHLIAGSPLAEFERFLCSASPVIRQRHHNGNCFTCSGQEQTSDSLCLHQIHNITLGSLWQWYEEPGCYGLEVKAEDSHKSKRLRDGFVEFRAYFVPYLSAVQLFGRSGSDCAISSEKMTVSCEDNKAPTSLSNLSSLPVFSVLLPPQRHKEVDACFLESTLPTTNEFCDQSVKQTNPIDGELIFEYFEHAQPPQRRPLFEKINELVSGGYSPNSYMYGDPLKLECSSLHDLHPASWYAVAWYPIYRIPEGNFRAAFLTYHSLGHFIHQSASSNMAGDFTRIISPVVGLQSYNAKKECWFRPRDMKAMEVQKEEDSPSKLLEERLKTLEQTAFVMATATVCKGNQRPVNSHPDYNHFSSRW